MLYRPVGHSTAVGDVELAGQENPGLQGVHWVMPPVLYSPAAHSVPELLTAPPWHADPGGAAHATHTPLPPKLYCPDVQATPVALGDPLVHWYPGGLVHSRQSLAPPVLLNRPWGQGTPTSDPESNAQ